MQRWAGVAGHAAPALSQSLAPQRSALLSCVASSIHLCLHVSHRPGHFQERVRQEYLATVKGRDEKALTPEIEELHAKKATEIEEARVRKERALKEEVRGLQRWAGVAALGGRGFAAPALLRA